MTIQHLRRDGLLQTLAVWITVGVLFALVLGPLTAALTPFLVLPLWAGYWLVGVGVLVAGVVRVMRPQSRREATVALVLALVFLAAMWLGGGQQLTRAGDALEFRLRFARLESRYAALVSEVQREGTAQPGFQRRNGAMVVVDSGPPRRLAFIQPGGIVDNWEGIVYDPTAAVAQARGWRYGRGEPEFTAPAEVRSLFGGDIVSCRHVRGPWYRCWFT